MYVPEFICGIVAVILLEIIGIVFYALSKRDERKDDDYIGK